MRNLRDLLILAGLLLALGLFVYYGPGQARPTEPEITTTHSSADPGALALYRWVGALGYDAQRLEYRDFVLTDADAALIVLNPGEPIRRQDARDVLDWVERGGTLIVADESETLLSAPNALFKELEFETTAISGTVDLLVPGQPALHAPPVGTLPLQARRALTTDRTDYAALLVAGDALLVAGVQHGAGYVVLSATAEPFTNAGLRDAQRAALVLNALRTVPAGGRVLFDEYHHGYITAPTVNQGLLRTPWGWAGLYIALVVGGYLALSGRRFGRPVPLAENTARRSSAEFVESLADLFQRAAKRGFVQERAATALKRRLAKPYALNPTLDDQAFLAELTRARGAAEPGLAALLARLRATPANETVLVQNCADAVGYQLPDIR